MIEVSKDKFYDNMPAGYYTSKVNNAITVWYIKDYHTELYGKIENCRYYITKESEKIFVK